MSKETIQEIYEIVLEIEDGEIDAEKGLNTIACICIDVLGLSQQND